MSSASETIIFFGSGPVALESLKRLSQHTRIEAIVTKPSTIDTMAATVEAPVYAVQTKSELDTLIATQQFGSRLGVVIDFGIIISRYVIDSFTKGIINSHFSLLPQLRGADPLSFAILEGYTKSGVSLMLIDERMDEGPLLAQVPYDLAPDETTISLTNSLIAISDQALQKNIPLWLAGNIKAKPQEVATIADPPKPSYTRKLTKQDGVIDWQKPAVQLEREIRAFLDWPKSQTKLGDIPVVITAAKVLKQQELNPGSVRVIGKELLIGCGGDSALAITSLKPAGKKEMPASSFLAGYGSRLSAS